MKTPRQVSSMRRNEHTPEEARIGRLIQSLDQGIPAPDAEFLLRLREATTVAFLESHRNASPAQPAVHSTGALELPALQLPDTGRKAPQSGLKLGTVEIPNDASHPTASRNSNCGSQAIVVGSHEPSKHEPSKHEPSKHELKQSELKRTVDQIQSVDHIQSVETARPSQPQSSVGRIPETPNVSAHEKVPAESPGRHLRNAISSGNNRLRQVRTLLCLVTAILLAIGFLPDSLVPSRGAPLGVAFDNLARANSAEIELQNGNASGVLLLAQNDSGRVVKFEFASGNVEMVAGNQTTFFNSANNTIHVMPPVLLEELGNDIRPGERLLDNLNVADASIRESLLRQRPRAQVEQNGQKKWIYRFQRAMHDQGGIVNVDASVDAQTNELLAIHSELLNFKGDVTYRGGAQVLSLNKAIAEDRFQIAPNQPEDVVTNVAMVESIQGNPSVDMSLSYAWADNTLQQTRQFGTDSATSPSLGTIMDWDGGLMGGQASNPIGQASKSGLHNGTFEEISDNENDAIGKGKGALNIWASKRLPYPTGLSRTGPSVEAESMNSAAVQLQVPGSPLPRAPSAGRDVLDGQSTEPKVSAPMLSKESASEPADQSLPSMKQAGNDDLANVKSKFDVDLKQLALNSINSLIPQNVKTQSLNSESVNPGKSIDNPRSVTLEMRNTQQLLPSPPSGPTLPQQLSQKAAETKMKSEAAKKASVAASVPTPEFATPSANNLPVQADKAMDEPASRARSVGDLARRRNGTIPSNNRSGADFLPNAPRVVDESAKRSQMQDATTAMKKQISPKDSGTNLDAPGAISTPSSQQGVENESGSNSTVGKSRSNLERRFSGMKNQGVEADYKSASADSKDQKKDLAPETSVAIRQENRSAATQSSAARDGNMKSNEENSARYFLKGSTAIRSGNASDAAITDPESVDRISIDKTGLRVDDKPVSPSSLPRKDGFVIQNRPALRNAYSELQNQVENLPDMNDVRGGLGGGIGLNGTQRSQRSLNDDSLQPQLQRSNTVGPGGLNSNLPGSQSGAGNPYLFNDTMTQNGRRLAEPQTELLAGEVISTLEDDQGVVRARLANNAELILGPKSRVVLLGPTAVQLQDGEMELVVPEGDQIDLYGPPQEFRGGDARNYAIRNNDRIASQDAKSSDLNSGESKQELPANRSAYSNSYRGMKVRHRVAPQIVTGRKMFRVEKGQISVVESAPQWLVNFQNGSVSSPKNTLSKIQATDVKAAVEINPTVPVRSKAAN